MRKRSVVVTDRQWSKIEPRLPKLASSPKGAARGWRAFLRELDRRGRIKWSESFVDGSCASAKGGALESVSPAEITLLEKTLWMIRVPQTRGRPRIKPERVIGDKAHDSDRHRALLAKYGIELIAPNRSNRRKTQDGRALRRYRRRWLVERTFTWIGRFRRPAVRYDRDILMYQAFFHLACAIIVFRRL